MNSEPTLTLTLSMPSLNLVLAALSRQPWAEVDGLIRELRDQVAQGLETRRAQSAPDPTAHKAGLRPSEAA